MKREITQEVIAAGRAALDRMYRETKLMTYNESYGKTSPRRTSMIELREYLSNEKNADDFAFSAWCALQRQDWQIRRDKERAEYKKMQALKEQEA